MNIDIPSLTDTMITGVRHAISDRWSAIRDVAEPELQKLAQTIEKVSQLYAEGKIDAARAVQIFEVQRNAALTVVRTVQGLGILTAREALDGAVRSASDVVNRLVGFKLLSNEASGSPAKPAQPAKPVTRRVKAQFKAGKDI